MDLLLRLAWRNIWRSPRRTLLTVLAIAFATTVLMFFMGIQLKSYETGIGATTSLFHGHIQIQPQGYLDKPQMRKVLKNRGAIERAIGMDTNVSTFAPRAFAFVLVSSGDRSYGAQVMGIDTNREPTVSTLPQFVRQGSYLSNEDTVSAVIGKVLAKNLKVDIGSEITILGQGYDGSLASTVLKVKGIFETGSNDLDRGAVQMPLKEFDETFAMEGSVHTYTLRLKNFENIISSQLLLQSEISAEGLSGISVLRWDELLPGVKQSMELDMSAGWLFFSALIIIVCFSVLNTFLMSILERTKEFGVVLALGMSPGELRNLIIVEAIFLGAIGVLCGMVGGAIVVTALHSYGFTIPNTEEIRKTWNLPATIYPDLTLVVSTVGPTVLFIASILSGVYPALKAKKITILSALRGDIVMAAFGVVASLSYRNIWRNKKRSLITLFAVMMGLWSCATLSTLARGLSWGMAEETIKTLTGHIQIQAPEYQNNPSVEHSFSMSSVNPNALHDENINSWTARVRVPAIILSERESFGITLVGINPADEKKQSFLSSAIIEGEMLKSEDNPGIIIGKHLLDLLQTNVGKRVVLMSQDNIEELAERGFRIKGVYQANLKSTEQTYVFIGRKGAQDLLKIDNGVTEISIIAKDKEAIPGLIEKLKPSFSNLSVLSWREMSPFVSALLRLQSEFIGFLFLLVFVAVSFGVVNTLLMSVFERTHEIGLLRAIGMKPREIISQVVLESIYLVFLGAVCGNLFALSTYILLSKSGVDISFFAQGAEHFGSGRVIFPVIIKEDWVQIDLIVLVMGVLSGIYPAWKASKLKPVEAMTRGAR